MEWSLPKIFGLLGGAAVIVVAAIKHLLHENYKTKERLENLKDTHRNKAIQKLTELVRELNTDIKGLTNELHSYSLKAVRNEAKLEEYSSRLNAVISQFEGFEARLDDKVRSEIKTQIHKITDELVRVKEQRKKINGN